MQRVIQYLRDLEKFQEAMKEFPTPLLEELGAKISNELRNRAVEDASSRPMLSEEFALPKIEAIKAYQTRTGTSLRNGLAAYNYFVQNRRSSSTPVLPMTKEEI